LNNDKLAGIGFQFGCGGCTRHFLIEQERDEHQKTHHHKADKK